HMGWNTIKSKIQNPKSKVLEGVPDDAFMYFVHSYYVKPKDKGVILMTTDYGMEFASGVQRDNIYGFQFHPEKSQELGLKILKNFVRLK
ncbi:MAG: imidazole glycerol phosphate synthase subunit HisH, partial [Candidatus Omnitrophota bacterium]|nr:imidazole glycerol phosphate synthase subunit HisH [Candidatus Omnitrophota bacterium]